MNKRTSELQPLKHSRFSIVVSKKRSIFFCEIQFPPVHLSLQMQLQLEQLEQQKQQRGAQLQLMREQVARFAQRLDTAPILDRAVLTHVQETIKAMIDEE